MHARRATATFLVALVAALAIASESKTQAGFSQGAAQKPVLPSGAISTEEATAIAQLWQAIASGKSTEIVTRARLLLEKYPRSPSVLALVIETDLIRGASTALATYEGWFRGRSIEEPLVLRRIARALLYEWGRQDSIPNVRSEALLALADDGEQPARDLIAALAKSGGETGIRSGSRMENPDPVAIGQIAQRMKATKGIKSRDIELLAATKSVHAVQPLIDTLTDAEPQNRASAAIKLGDFPGANVMNALLPLLRDPDAVVRTASAAALLKLGNFAGLEILEGLAAMPEVAYRIQAAKLLSPRQDERWVALVRGLVNEPDPLVRLDAATMLAPHDPALARQVLTDLSRDPNLAIREEAEWARAGLPTSTLTELRGLMRDGQPRARVRAAARVLEVVR